MTGRFSVFGFQFSALAFLAILASPGSWEGPTYSKEIAPIVFKHCYPCHQTGGAAPFALASHEDVKKRAQQIVRNMMQRQMPPCGASTDYGVFCSVAPLTDQQIIAFEQWANAGAKLDVEVSPPTAPKEWPLGKPDAIVRVGEGVAGPLDGRPFWGSITVALPSDAKGFVRTVVVRPLSPRAVRHVAVFRTTGAVGVAPTNGVVEGTCEDLIGSYAPGYPAVAFPSGVGKELRGNLRLQVLLVPTGKAETAACDVGLYFSRQGVEPEWLSIGSRDIDIPIGLIRYDMQAAQRLPLDARVLSVVPEARLLCKRFSIAATLPDGTTKMLYDNDRYDAYWQGSYRFSKSVVLPKGTLISVEAQYDNSSHGGKNPNPKRTKYGMGSDDELFWAHIEYLPVR